MLIVQEDFWYGDDSCRRAGQTQEGTSFPPVVQLLSRQVLRHRAVCAGYGLYVVLTPFMLHTPSSLVQPIIFILYFGMGILVAHALDLSSRPPP